MFGLLSSDLWLYLILAAVVAAILVSFKSTGRAELLSAVFSVLGDAIALLVLYQPSNQTAL